MPFPLSRDPHCPAPTSKLPAERPIERPPDSRQKAVQPQAQVPPKREAVRPARGTGGAIWTPTDELMPPEGVVVETVTPGGRRIRLKWQHRLWLFEDDTNYLIHTPEYWRPLPAAEPAPSPPRPTVPTSRGIGPELGRLFRWGTGAAALAVATIGFTTPGLTVAGAFLPVVLTVAGLFLLFGAGWARQFRPPAERSR